MIVFLVLSCWYRNGSGRSVEEFEADVDHLKARNIPEFRQARPNRPRQIRAHEKAHWPYHSNYDVKALSVPEISKHSEGPSMFHLSFRATSNPTQ
jgi:hypothetical protein